MASFCRQAFKRSHAAAAPALMHWFLLIVSSSMGTEENLRLLSFSRPRPHLPPCDIFLAPSTIPGTGFGVFAGRAFKQDEIVFRSWMVLFLPRSFPQRQALHSYVFKHNNTHMALDLDYGSIINHHEHANAKAAGVANMYYRATKDIAAGQEILIRYGSAQWFERKNIPYADVDYARTMWRPGLHPLPCRQKVNHAIRADGRHSFALCEAVPSGTVVEVSLCLEVSVIIVDQLPFLRDFVLYDQGEANIGDIAEQAYLPLSYAAQIPTTQNPDLANVRLSLSNLDNDVKGAAKIMVSVVATQDLKVGDVLWRFEEKAAQDEPRRAQRLLNPLSVFSPESRDELNSAVEDCLGESNRVMRLHGPIGNWDVSQVTDMSKVFYIKDTFNYDLSNWDVSRVTNMREIFFFGASFNQDLSNWDVSRVTDMGAMFVDADSFNQDLCEWDVSRVTDMGAMFLDADSFNQDLCEWDVSRVTDMASMFSQAKSFNQDLSKWDVSRVINMQAMFENANSFQQTLCGAAWVNSNASKVDMFNNSPGSISSKVCVFSPQSWDDLKHAVDDCKSVPG